MSEGSEVWGGTERAEGRGAGRGTPDASAGGREDSTGPGELDGFKPSSFVFGGVAEGLEVLAASAFSIRFGLGVSFSGSVFFFGVGDLSASALGLFLLAGVSLALAFGLGVTSSSSSLSPDFLPGDFDAFGFGVGDVSSSSAGVFFGFGFGVGVGVAFFFVFFFVFDFRFAGFGFAIGSGVSDGVGEVTARISSRAFFFFSGSVDWA